MAPQKMLPVGIEDFKEIRKDGFYYMEQECQKALDQINEKHYTDIFRQTDLRRILKYGIACSRKSCKVLAEKEILK
ncbi:MAG TPA: hypothetical protein H9753_07510 [Candidatus Blautia merdavium]|uniref:Uncharacterized protein n=1 Tax=Candidatus Blautia merdavium TaxID=2838494 RepID=A0A9D2TCA3_9FIRM|nr:hypothetical protein [Candidatus Blautia merdavium]